MPDEHENSPQVIGSIDELNQPLRARVDAVEEANQRALDKADKDNREKIEAIRSALEAKIDAADIRLSDRIASVKELLTQRIDTSAEKSEQYQEQQRYALEVASAEREKSAEALRVQVSKAQEQADAEREKSAAALRESLSREIATGDENLRQHIDHQREQVDASFTASREAINKADVATEKRFQAYDQLWTEIRTARSETIPREVFEQDRADARRRQDATLELIQGLSVRMTEMEARGGGEKDYAADLKSTLAVAVAVVSVIASVAITLILGL